MFPVASRLKADSQAWLPSMCCRHFLPLTACPGMEDTCACYTLSYFMLCSCDASVLSLQYFLSLWLNSLSSGPIWKCSLLKGAFHDVIAPPLEGHHPESCGLCAHLPLLTSLGRDDLFLFYSFTTSWAGATCLSLCPQHLAQSWAQVSKILSHWLSFSFPTL